MRHSLAILLACLAAGCGGSDAPPPAAETQTAPAPTTPTTAPAAKPQVVQSADTKWLGKVPYDVFYDKPVEMLGGPMELGEPIAAVTPAAAAATPTTRASAAAEPPAAAAGGQAGGWSQLIAPEVLDAESKLIRTRLTANLQRVATYNRSTDAISTDAVLLAALAGVAEKYEADMRWKERAPAVRTLAYEVYENTGGTGRSAFEKAAMPFEKLIVVLDGGQVDGVEPEEAEFGDYADLANLMIRTKQGFDWLKGTIASADNLSKNREDAIREASVLAMIGRMAEHDSYGYADEASYVDFAGQFTRASTDAREAAAADDFAAFQDAVGRIQNQCAACHAEYKFGGDGI